jgi:beta-xylosidase
MAPDGSKLLGEGEVVFHEPAKHPILEGPKFLKKAGWYYILAPAGGVEHGWQVALRSRNIYGPYADKVVLEQGLTKVNGPHQGALVDTENDGWWFVHFQDAGIYGRIVHLQPVAWQDDWPRIGNAGQPVLFSKKPRVLGRPPIAPQTSDEFNSAKLGLQWQWPANHADNWFSLTARPGWLRLFSQTASGDTTASTPNLLLQKFPARSFTIETVLEFAPKQIHEEAGLVLSGESFGTLGLEKNNSGNRIILRIDGVQKFVHDRAPDTVKFRMTVKDGGLCIFSFALDDNFTAISQTFTARKGVWIGAKVGLYSVKRLADEPAGHVDVDYFRFT